MFKKLLIVLALVAVGAGSYGIARALFSSNGTTDDNTFTTGALTIVVSQDQMGGQIHPVISNWFPGDTAEVKFEVTNTSPKPINLAAYATGSWNAGLDDTMVKAIKIDYWKSGMPDWTEIKSDSNGITGLVYYSPIGTNADLYAVAPGEKVYFKITTEFDIDANNDYANQIYTANITVNATQVAL